MCNAQRGHVSAAAEHVIAGYSGATASDSHGLPFFHITNNYQRSGGNLAHIKGQSNGKGGGEEEGGGKLET